MAWPIQRDSKSESKNSAQNITNKEALKSGSEPFVDGTVGGGRRGGCVDMTAALKERLGAVLFKVGDRLEVFGFAH